LKWGVSGLEDGLPVYSLLADINTKMEKKKRSGSSKNHLADLKAPPPGNLGKTCLLCEEPQTDGGSPLFKCNSGAHCKELQQFLEVWCLFLSMEWKGWLGVKRGGGRKGGPGVAIPRNALAEDVSLRTEQRFTQENEATCSKRLSAFKLCP